MKSKLILTLLLCAMLTSCASPSTPMNDLNEDTGFEETTTAQSPQDIVLNDKTKIAYYEHLVNELQAVCHAGGFLQAHMAGKRAQVAHYGIQHFLLVIYTNDIKRFHEFERLVG